MPPEPPEPRVVPLGARAFFYFATPVALAVLAEILSNVWLSRGTGAQDILAIALCGLIAGFLCMGLQSVLFAITMLWLERLWANKVLQGFSALVLGGLAGASLAVAGDDHLILLRLAPLGAAAGVATWCGAYWLAPGLRAPGRYVGTKLAAMLLIVCGGSLVGNVVYQDVVQARRLEVLGAVEIGMTFDEVQVVAGRPPDAPYHELDVPVSELGPHRWCYHGPDPGGAQVLIVSIDFLDGRVVSIRREPHSRG